jgi:hypothetical protein
MFRIIRIAALGLVLVGVGPLTSAGDGAGDICAQTVCQRCGPTGNVVCYGESGECIVMWVVD